MPRTIQLAAILPAPPGRLFDMYLDPASHAAFTGAPVSIGTRSGAKFRAFNGALQVAYFILPPRIWTPRWS